ncbi:MAG: T9SS type A sorting domain-containing protein [Bacteroidota bacterium]
MKDFETQQYQVLGQAKGSGAGTTAAVNTYHHEDYIQLATQDRYYRIKQVQLDGNIEYSAIRSLNFGQRDARIHIYPNPFAEQLTVVLPEKFQPKSEEITLEIVDVSGKVIHQQTGNLAQSRVYQIDLDAGNGVYQVNVKAAGYKMLTKKVIKLKE